MLAAGLSLSLPRAMAQAEPTAPTSGGLDGWREAVVITPDLAPWIETLTVVGGWECALRAPADDSHNAVWGLPSGARVEQALMRNIGTHTGLIRLVKVTGAPQQPIRPDDQAWEAGGVQALDVRVVDIETTRRELHARGWRAPSEPVRYKTYGVEVIQWAPSSPDGVRLSFIQRLAPPLQGWTELKRWSRVSNAAITVRDMTAAKAFFGETLGLKPTSSSHVVGDGGPNVMGLPWAFAASAPIEIVGFTGASANDGAIELISIPQALGRDYAGAAHPPNLGIAALRHLVLDLDGLARRLAGHGIVTAPSNLHLPPYGPCRVLAVDGTDGVRLEFVQPQG